MGGVVCGIPVKNCTGIRISKAYGLPLNSLLGVGPPDTDPVSSHCTLRISTDPEPGCHASPKAHRMVYTMTGVLSILWTYKRA